MRAGQYSFRRLLRLREIAQVDRQSPDPFVGREIVRTAPSTRWSWRRLIAPTRKSPRNCKLAALPSVPSVIAWRRATRRRRHLKVADWDWRSKRQIGDRLKTGTRSAMQGGRVPAEPNTRSAISGTRRPVHSFRIILSRASDSAFSPVPESDNARNRMLIRRYFAAASPSPPVCGKLAD